MNFQKPSPKKIQLIETYKGSKPHLLSLMISLTESLPLNFDFYLNFFNRVMEQNQEIVLAVQRAEPVAFKQAVVSLIDATNRLLSPTQQMNVLVDAHSLYLVGKKKIAGGGKGLRFDQLSNMLQGDITKSINKLLADETYNAYGLDKKEAYVKSFKKAFKSSAQNLEALHSKLSFYLNTLPEKEIVVDQQKISNLNGKTFAGFTVAVPQTNIELKLAGVDLNICVGNGNYVYKIQQKQSFVFFLKDASEIKYCIEVCAQTMKIRQFVGHSNKSVGKLMEMKLNQFLREHKIKNSLGRELINRIYRACLRK